ncbi:unnamed protein product [Cyclocybe aegerita]|uniref:F-box domain-containing protein n=1 Tax=Cyclocybe aegerita TaxID=1973307 RepID=A0A8S0WQV8_CYCAE|nr:unnamed protein product [Cyclocybe aegerita]
MSEPLEAADLNYIVTKRMRLNWSTHDADLERKIQEAKEELQGPDRVRLDIRFWTKKGVPPPPRREMMEYVQKVADMLKDVSNEWRPRAIFRRDATLFLQSTKKPSIPLPPEILIQVFSAYCTPCRHIFGKCKHPGCGRAVPALVLISVCRKWRAIARDSPVLWTTIKLSMRINGQISVLRDLLTLSKNRPISLCIRFERGVRWWEGVNPAPDALFSLIFAHSMRWKALELWFSENRRLFVGYLKSLLSRVLGQVRGRTPLLQKLSVRHLRPHSLLTILGLPELFSGGRLNGQWVTNLWGVVRWDGDLINELTVSTTHDHQLHLEMDIPDLEDDIVWVSMKSFMELLASLPIHTCTLPRLTVLTVVGGKAALLLPFLDAPSLHTLNVLSDANLSSLADFIKRSKPQLVKLCLKTGTPIDITSLFDILSTPAVDSVTTLHLQSCRASDYKAWTRIIPEMLNPAHTSKFSSNRGRTSKAILPNLQKLIYSTEAPIMYPEIIADMIKTRWNYGISGDKSQPSQGVSSGPFARLRTVHLRPAPPCKAQFHSLLRSEISQGLTVHYNLRAYFSVDENLSETASQSLH